MRLAQRRVGWAYEEGEEGVLGLKTDFDMALMWSKKAAECGDHDAQCRLGCAHEEGEVGLKIDFDMALMWFKKAAEGGDGDAQWRLGVAYEDGDLGVVTNFKTARTYFQEAAKAGDHDAQRPTRLGLQRRDIRSRDRSRGGDHVAPEGSGR